MNHATMLTQRPTSVTDPSAGAGFALPAEKPFFCFPEAVGPLTAGPLAAAATLPRYAKAGYRPQASGARRDPQGRRLALGQLEQALV